MKTSRDFLVVKLYGENKYICKCCGKEVAVEEVDCNYSSGFRKKTITKYECNCEGWNEIINAKNKMEELNRGLSKAYDNYISPYKQTKAKIYRKYGIDLCEYVWLKELESKKK